MIRFIIFLAVLYATTEIGYSQNLSLGAGISYGGPIPTEVIDSTSGNILLGYIAGLSYTIPISERISFVPQLYYSSRGLDYGQIFTRDTLIRVNINGIIGELPSYYTAYVDGKMRLHYIDIPLLISYRIWKFQLLFGPYFSFLIAGSDAGNVRAVVGTGGFIDDYNEAFDNYPALRKMEQGLVLGSHFPVYKKLSVEMKVTRSFLTLYDLNKLADNGQGVVKMYNTYMQLALVYQFQFSKQSK